MKKQKELKKKKQDQNKTSSSLWGESQPGKIDKNEKVLLEIKQHPLKKNLFLSVTAILIILMAGLFSYTIIPNILMPIFVYLFFIISMTSFFMPSRYTFTEEKILINRIIYSKSYPWKRFRSYKLDKNGIYLSPTSNPDRFDRFRGVFLVMDKEGREKTAPILEKQLAKPSQE